MKRKLFSERMGYTVADDAIVRERITEGIENGICNCCDSFKENLEKYNGDYLYTAMEKYLWQFFLKYRVIDFYYNNGHNHEEVLVPYILDVENPWFKKLNIIEESLFFLYQESKQNSSYQGVIDVLIEMLNQEFERLNFAYRIIDRQIVEVTAEEEIFSIKKALEESNDSVKEHLTNALTLCSKRPVGDYRNSIKESISAVEYICRKKTGEKDLGRSLSKLQKKGVIIPKILKNVFEKLYDYTNNEVTGIRHALMDDEGTYTPGSDEAIFMIVSCSAFINYLNKK